MPQKVTFMTASEQDFDVFMSIALVALAEINPDIDAILRTRLRDASGSSTKLAGF